MLDSAWFHLLLFRTGREGGGVKAYNKRVDVAKGDHPSLARACLGILANPDLEFGILRDQVGCPSFWWLLQHCFLAPFVVPSSTGNKGFIWLESHLG